MLKANGNVGWGLMLFISAWNIFIYGGTFYVLMWVFDYFIKTPWSRG